MNRFTIPAWTIIVCYAEIDTLQSVLAEIYDSERRKLAREYEKKKTEVDDPKSYKINVV